MSKKPKKQPAAEATYKVGYCRAPEKDRFQPGKSGNPKGRPKGSKSLKTIYRSAFEKSVAIKIDGKPTNMMPKEIAMHRQAHKAMEGDHKATMLMLQLEGQFAPPDDTLTPEVIAADLSVLDNILALRALTKEAEHDQP